VLRDDYGIDLTNAGTLISVALSALAFVLVQNNNNTNQQEKEQITQKFAHLESHADSTNRFEEEIKAKVDSLLARLEKKDTRDHRQDSVIMLLFMEKIKAGTIPRERALLKVDGFSGQQKAEFMDQFKIKQPTQKQ